MLYNYEKKSRGKWASFYNDNTWIKPEDSENLAKTQKMEEQAFFT